LVTLGIRDFDPATILEDHPHYTRRQKKFGAMEPNTKLLIDELVKIREEIKESFTSHEIAITNHFAKFSVAEQLHDAHIFNFESTVPEFNKTFVQWKPEVDASLSTINLEISKLNTFFDREAKQTSASEADLRPTAHVGTALNPHSGIVGTGVFTLTPMTRTMLR
jgi:hypothetical protein